jgi:hypothetical protein
MIFSVSVLFQTTSPAHPEEHHLWEDRILLIFSDSPESAREMAEAIALKAEFDYVSAEDKLLCVRFVCLERVCEISELSNGSELFSRYLKDAEAKSILQPFDD